MSTILQLSPGLTIGLIGTCAALASLVTWRIRVYSLRQKLIGQDSLGPEHECATGRQLEMERTICYGEFLSNICIVAAADCLDTRHNPALQDALGNFFQLRKIAPDEVVKAAQAVLDSVDPDSELAAEFNQHLDAYESACRKNLGVERLPGKRLTNDPAAAMTTSKLPQAESSSQL